ncbi:hypothetical protein D3C84_1215210 [compost metagenome]
MGAMIVFLTVQLAIWRRSFAKQRERTSRSECCGVRKKRQCFMELPMIEELCGKNECRRNVSFWSSLGVFVRRRERDERMLR